MGEKRRRPGHHASAAHHYGQAAQHHSALSTHHHGGRDHTDVVHMKIMARGHATRALFHQNGAQIPQENLHIVPPDSLKTSFDNVLRKPGVTKGGFNIVTYQAIAVLEHKFLTKSQTRSPAALNRENYLKAAYKANIAHRYARHAVFQGDEADRHHIEHYGKTGPTAEIL